MKLGKWSTEQIDKLQEEARVYNEKYPAKTLFPPSWENLLKRCCPFCGYKLYSNLKGDVYRCKSVKCPGFAIKENRLRELSTPKKTNKWTQ